MPEPNESQFKTEPMNLEESESTREGVPEQLEEAARFSPGVTANNTPGGEGGTQG